VVRKGNWLGAQFHPERSSEAGARFLDAFLQMLATAPAKALSEIGFQQS